MVDLLPLVNRIARKVARRLPPSVSFDDLVAAGRLGLVEALERYDARRNDNFAAYAELRVRGAILDEVRAMDWAPRAVRRRRQKLVRAEQKLTGELGRPPEEHELAKVLDIDTLTLRKMEQELSAVLLFENDALDRSATGPAPLPSTQVVRGERVQQLAEAIEHLPERERQVIALYYIEELKLRSIGELMGVTESRVCQLHTRALGRLRTELESLDGFVEHLAA